MSNGSQRIKHNFLLKLFLIYSDSEGTNSDENNLFEVASIQIFSSFYWTTFEQTCKSKGSQPSSLAVNQ